MNCQDREPDLLLFGLDELPSWKRRQVARHLRSCARCRARQQELAMLSSRIADALQPPPDGTNSPWGAGMSQPIRLLRYGLAPLALALMLTLLTLSMMGIWYFETHHTAQSISKDAGCRPDLPNDRCK
jgi:anti-sigma factor RsiW